MKITFRGKDITDKFLWNKDDLIKMLAMLAMIILAIMVIASVYAASWPLPKPLTCITLNLTTEACDIFWCNSVLACEYNLTSTACICREIINQTITLNCTDNSSISYALNSSDYYNKTEVNSLIVGNYSDLKTNLSDYTDKQDLKLRDSILDRVDRVEQDINNLNGYENTSKQDIPYTFIGICVVVVACLIGFGIYSKQKERKQKLSEKRSKSGLTYGDPDEYYGEEDKEEDAETLNEQRKAKPKKPEPEIEEEYG